MDWTHTVTHILEIDRDKQNGIIKSRDATKRILFMIEQMVSLEDKDTFFDILKEYADNEDVKGIITACDNYQTEPVIRHVIDLDDMQVGINEDAENPIAVEGLRR